MRGNNRKQKRGTQENKPKQELKIEESEKKRKQNRK